MQQQIGICMPRLVRVYTHLENIFTPVNKAFSLIRARITFYFLSITVNFVTRYQACVQYIDQAYKKNIRLTRPNGFLHKEGIWLTVKKKGRKIGSSDWIQSEAGSALDRPGAVISPIE
jgi:hypothetical protein